ncbi:type II toxin-antitoxin system HicA family toxin [Actinomadura viridis]|uniref:type II toxin-antitoxin system HicA family toxin n=1 Tax=Actinomadura viridis TaxID=58110 RepID=UPI0036C4B174
MSGAQVVKALGNAGFDLIRITGSHHRMAHADGRRVSIPAHAGRDMARGTLRSIIRDAGLTVEEFIALLD